MPDNDDLKQRKPAADEQLAAPDSSFSENPESWIDLNVTGALPAYLQEQQAARPQDEDTTGDMPALQAQEIHDPNATVAVAALEELVDPNATVSVPSLEVELDPHATTEVPSLFGSAERQAAGGNQSEEEELNANDPDSALTPEQRTLLKVVSQLRDAAAFNEANEKLQVAEDELLLSEQKLELLESVAVDVGPFVDPELETVLKDETSLTEEQKILLEVVSKLKDEETFHEEIGVLKDEGQVIPEEERWILEQNKNLLSPEEQRQEFLKDEADLAGTRTQEIVFKPFVDSTPLSEVPADSEFTDLDAIPTPDVIPADYSPLIAMQEDKPGPGREVKEGIIGRPVEGGGRRIAGYARAVKKTVASEKIIVPFVLVMLSLGLFLLPGYLRKQLSGEESEAMAAEQLELTMAQEMDNQIPDASQDPQATRFGGEQGSTSGAIGGAPTHSETDAPGEMAATSGPLEDARKLASKGYTKRALELYHMYLASNPRAIAVRIELIKMLMSAKENMLARAECIDAMKLRPTLEQMQEITALYQRVQLD